MAKTEPAKTSERSVQRSVVTYLRKEGWTVHIFSGSLQAQPGLRGFPDLMCMRRRKDGLATILYVECKAKGSGLRPSQQGWKLKNKDLLSAGNVYYAVAEATNLDNFRHVLAICYQQSGFTHKTWIAE